MAAGFPPAEYEARADKAHYAMRAAGLSALLFTTEAEIRYFTGFRTAFWQSPTRPWFVVLPLDAAPIAIIPEIGAPLMRAAGVQDIRTWSSPHVDDDGVSLVAAALAGRGRIGMPQGRESSLRMPLADFWRLQNSLEGAEFIDASPLMQTLRMVKSEAEIAIIARICAIRSAAFANADALFAVGQPLDEAFRAFKMELLCQGAEDIPYLVGGAGHGGYRDIISPPDATPLQPGDVLMLDTGASLQGYFSDFDRNFALIHASDAAKQAHVTLHKATDAGLLAAHPEAHGVQTYFKPWPELLVRGAVISGAMATGLVCNWRSRRRSLILIKLSWRREWLLPWSRVWLSEPGKWRGR